MTKLEWCRKYAPDVLQYLSDDELVEKYSKFYDLRYDVTVTMNKIFEDIFVDIDEEESTLMQEVFALEQETRLRILRDLDHSLVYVRVLGNVRALGFNGLCRTCVDQLWLQTETEYQPELPFTFLRWMITETSSDLAYAEPFESCKNIYLPSSERAIVDSLKYYDYYGTEEVYDSLEEYMDTHEDLSKLYEVAEHFKLPEEKLDWWIEEVRSCPREE